MKETNRLEWINPTNQEQCDWAISYLIKKKISNIQLLTTSYETLINWNNITPKNIAYADLLIQMRQAWKQKVFRSNNKHRKPYSFMLSKAVKKELDDLSIKRGKSITDCIEEIILGEKDIDKRLKERVNDLRVKTSEKISKHKQAARIYKKLFDSTLYDLVRSEEKIRKANLTESEVDQYTKEELENVVSAKIKLIYSGLPVDEKLILEFSKRLVT
jgi:macrodomain Ter protein organizer (MatP/YcbG family)